MSSAPDPDRGWNSPPPALLTVVGAAEPGQGVGLQLSNPEEEQMFRRGFESLGFEVHLLELPLFILVDLVPECLPPIIITDDPEAARERYISELPEKDLPYIVLLVDPGEEELLRGWKTGADLVVPRPVNPDDP